MGGNGGLCQRSGEMGSLYSSPLDEVKPLKKVVSKRKTIPKKASKEEETQDGLDWARMSPLEKAVRQDLKRYPDAILLTQVGSFYESYFEQARTVSRVLGIKLTNKIFGRKDETKARQPFCGFPLAQLVKHVSVLVEAGHKVVIVEEFKERGDETIRRKVTRVVTAGTGVEESFVSLERPNYVLALGVVEGASTKDEVGMAYRDISTGASFTRTSKLSSLRDDIKLVQPKEVVVDETVKATRLGERILELLEGEQRREGLAVARASTEAVPSSSSAVRSPTSAAEDVLLSYLASTLLSSPPPASTTKHIDPASVMQLDAVTLQSLEVRESLRGGVRGSLLSAVRKTSTPGGYRLLADRLTNPSTELSVINDRLDLVEGFLTSLAPDRPTLQGLLRTLDDTPRLLQRLALNRPNPAIDLLGLRRTLAAVETIRALLLEALPADGDSEGSSSQDRVLHELFSRLEPHPQLAEDIDAAIDEDALSARQELEERKAAMVAELGASAWEKEKEKEAREFEGNSWGQAQPWVIRSHFSPSLQRYHRDLASLRQEADALQVSLREKYRAPNLTLRTKPKVGATVHVLTKDGVSKIEADPKAILTQRHQTTRLYVLQEWVSLHQKIVATEEKLLALEKEAMQVLVARTLEQYNSLLSTADAVAELDVALGFAELAEERHWVRPVVNESKSLDILGGRHPTVENALMAQNRAFDPNDVRFDHPDDRLDSASLIHVLTGPNMAGKSTYLRQTALIVILAQAGSYVPASKARIGIFDRVFSRVGARDELDRDRSTFMIECDEASSILHNATDRSLVLLDELGRGTSPLDGVSIAYAALDHLAHVNRSRTLFATHFHRLGALLGYDERDPLARAQWEGVEFWCTDVEESEDAIRFPHTIRRGLNVDSGGITIARLANMPTRTILCAREVREKLRKAAYDVV
ncbi:hypothetical protein JCM10213v2_006680 [Rhodosporidiobolus nylandii]